MALARVVQFDGVTNERVEELRARVSEEDQPEGMNPTEVVLLHDADGEKAVVVLFFDKEDDYARADEVLNSMPAGDTPGQRSSVAKYEVAIRATP